MLKFLRKWFSLFLIIALSGGILWQQQNILDYIKLRGYEPPVRIEQLAVNTTMNDYGKRLFFVHKPLLADKATFNEHCRLVEHSIVLGCYVQNRGIYIYDVADPRLSGIHEVTAAHEMLHGAYDRLSSSERDTIDKLLDETFKALKNDRIAANIKSYAERDETVVPTELHSILATEVRDLPPALEEYYKKYFADRGVVVGYSEKYEKTFTDINNQVVDYDARLAKLKNKIDKNNLAIEDLNVQIVADKAQLDAYLDNGNTTAYNNSVAPYNAKVKRYNALINENQKLVDSYNRLAVERNTLASQEQELINAVDSRKEQL